MMTLGYNPYEAWESHHIDLPGEEGIMGTVFKQDNPTVGGFDTETTGLHILRDKPFLIQFGWLLPLGASCPGRVFTFEPKKKVMEMFFS